MGLVEKTQDSRENPCGLLARHMHDVYISVCHQRGGGETPPSAKGFQEKSKAFFSCMLSDNCLCILAERRGEEEGEKAERERVLTEKAKQIETIISPFPGRTVCQI